MWVVTATLEVSVAKNSEAFVGAVFGRMTVAALYQKIVGTQGKKKLMALCYCGCAAGTVKQVAYQDLGDKVVSCGCLKVERLTTHGGTDSFEYRVWADMIQRCFNPNNKVYAKYKDRAPPEHWKTFEGFIVDVGKAPNRTYTLDRIDNDAPYSKGNCKWSTRMEQVVNRGITVWVNNGAESLCVTHAANLVGKVPLTALASIRRGMPVQLVLGPEWSLGKVGERPDTDIIFTE